MILFFGTMLVFQHMVPVANWRGEEEEEKKKESTAANLWTLYPISTV